MGYGWHLAGFAWLALDRQPRSVRHRPQLSDDIQTLMQQAWLLASLNGEEHIRSVHLLMALVEKPKLARCDGLWPLLTLARASWSACDRCWMRNRMNVRNAARSRAGAEPRWEVEFVGRPAGVEMKRGN
jgi:type VI secretion system protein VasG